MIEAKKLSKSFDKIRAVRDVSFRAEKGEIFGIVGPNGAGKSTIVKMLCTILSPTTGTAIVNGLDVQEHAEKVRGMVGYLPEEPRVYDHMSGRDFLRFFADMYDVENAEQRINELLEFFDLKEHGDRVIGDYSKGMKQRISISRALIHNPSVIIFDEPTMGLDPASARDLREKILGLKEEGKTIFMCTHYMDEADFLCDKLAILNNGKIVAIGKPEELKAKLAKKQFISVVLKENSASAKKFVKELKAETHGRSILIPVKNTSEGLKRINSAAEKKKLTILSIKNVEPTLDDVFIALTRK